MDVQDCQFFAEQRSVDFIPNFTGNEEEFISTGMVRFEAGTPINIPIWMAIVLKNRQNGRVVPPTWLDPKVIETFIEQERQPTFSKLPDDFFCVAMIMLTKFKDDVEDVDLIRTAVQDLWGKRMSKLSRTADGYLKQTEGYHATILNITEFEAAYVKPIIMEGTRSIDDFKTALHKIMASSD
uniref:GINS complex subunit 2 n=1 Tax=Rhabditophanes sp. KR3021 TaxID=114890 RepID=A0AC35TZD4_9BILA